MKYVVFTVFLVFAAISVVYGQTTVCSRLNEEYSTCGPACENTCTSRTGQSCIQICVEGCFCKSGYVRNSTGDCVRLCDC